MGDFSIGGSQPDTSHFVTQPAPSTAGTEKSKRPIKLVPLIIGHLFLGFGIVYIGARVKNKLEIIFGVLLFLIIILGPLSALLLSPSVGECILAERMGNDFYRFYSGQCSGYLFSKVLPGLVGLLAWGYIIIRLIWIKTKGTTQITVF